MWRDSLGLFKGYKKLLSLERWLYDGYCPNLVKSSFKRPLGVRNSNELNEKFYKRSKNYKFLKRKKIFFWQEKEKIKALRKKSGHKRPILDWIPEIKAISQPWYMLLFDFGSGSKVQKLFFEVQGKCSYFEHFLSFELITSSLNQNFSFKILVSLICWRRISCFLEKCCEVRLSAPNFFQKKIVLEENLGRKMKFETSWFSLDQVNSDMWVVPLCNLNTL